MVNHILFYKPIYYLNKNNTKYFNSKCFVIRHKMLRRFTLNDEAFFLNDLIAIIYILIARLVTKRMDIKKGVPLYSNLC